MNEIDKCKQCTQDQIRAEKIIKTLNNSKFFVSNLSYRSRNRRTFTRFQLQKWLWQDKLDLDNIINSLIASKAIVEVTENVYAISKDFSLACFFPNLNNGESPTDSIQNSEF